MSKRKDNLWVGLDQSAQNALTGRDYQEATLATRIADPGVDASELASLDRRKSEIAKIWIPGVEIFPRKIHSQRHRGFFGELAREKEGILATIGLWPQQWAAARMFAHTAKGFHIHPPSIPSDTTPKKWHRRLFADGTENYSLRRYDHEQWDVMFFIQGRVEMILRDLRAGVSARTMRFFIDGDDHRSANNVGVVIPAGVAHALRVEGSDDVITVYGTTTSFHPEFEGRIASEIESAELPKSWQKFLSS